MFLNAYLPTAGQSSSDLSVAVAAPQRLVPRPHQSDAVRSLTGELSRGGDDARATGIMACGTGKTLVMLKTAETFGDRAAFFEPTLALIAQNLREWRVNARSGTKFLAVCSDRSVVPVGEDSPIFSPSELNARVTSNPDEIADFLRGSGRRIVISTLDSSPVVARAMTQRAVPAFDCVRR